MRALATVRQVMPARLRQRVDALQITPVDRAGARERPRVDVEHLLAIGTAVRACEVLRFDYARSAGGAGIDTAKPPGPRPPSSGPRGGWSRTIWLPGAGAGTSWRGIWSGSTGARSASTG